MPLPSLVECAGLVVKAQAVLGLTQETLGDLLGVSRRTVIRWNGGSTPSSVQLIALAKAVHPKDAALASALAFAGGARLSEIGLEPAAPDLASRAVVIDAIVCAAAEAGAVTPQAARAGLLAALERAAALGVSSEELRRALRK